MKRVVFGYEGGFPLEQETLMQIQAAYEEDMLDALFALWGLDTSKRYIVKLPENTNEEGWIISPQEILVRGVGQDDKHSEVNESDDIKEIKLQIIRLNYFTGGNRVVIEDKRLADGNLPYSEGTENKVYEEFVAKLVNSPVKDSIDLKSFIPLTSVIDIDKKVDQNTAEINIVKEDYLPRDGSKPMTGDLNLGNNKLSKLDTNEVFSASVRSADFLLGHSDRRGEEYPDRPLGRALVDNGEELHLNYNQDWGKTYVSGDVHMPNLKNSNSQTPLVIDGKGNVGINPSGILSSNFVPGMIMMWSGDENNVPKGWTLCDGKADINGIRIPDLKGRFVVGLDRDSANSPVENNNKDIENYGEIHNKGGAKSVQLSVEEIPPHNHSITIFRHGSSWDPGDNVISGHEEDDEINAPRDVKNTRSVGGGEYHENRPPYYVLAFIIYVGDHTPVTIIKPVANIKFDDEGNSIVRKTVTVDDGDNVIARIDGSNSQDPDGSIAQYIWERCFDNGTIQDPWTVISTQPNLTLLTFTIPASGKRYGTHYFRLKVIDNDGNVSLYSRQLEFVVNRRVIITPSKITLSEDRVIFEGYELAGLQTIQITGNPGWRVRSKDSFITVTPNSSNTSATTTVNLFIRPNPSIRNTGTVVFETTDGLDTATLNWSALIPIDIGIGGGGGGSCFDLESDILMASGQSKKLKNIVIGDELRTFNFVNPLSSTNEESSLLADLMKGATKETSKVVDFGIQTVAEYRKITLANGKILNVTASHPILASKDNNEVSWLLPDDLRGGYFIVDDNGKLIEIESKRTVKSSLEIGVLQLENGDNYFVNDVMVHNANIIRAVAREANNIQPLNVQPIDVIEK
ncbi:hypothetical protein [Tenacibaculum sp. 190524A05c]|uniref:hypothetical protein n=1 Tax=Tenacibaculum platacis TaxID=3137852 RepID=UPI0031FAD06C